MLKEKNWSKELEKQVTSKLKNQKITLKKTRKVYSIDTPPPYVNSPVHIGQAITYCYMDFFARYKRMQGYSVLFPLGLDRNGLPIEMATQKQFNVTPEQTGREKFIELCKKVLDKCSTESTETFARLGISFNSYKFGNSIEDAYLTDSEEYRKLTQATFYELWNKGLIYEDSRVSNYCPGCRTTLADAEISYEEQETQLYYIKFRLKDSKQDLVIATTRPEFIASCAVVLFNPADERYKKYDNKIILTPIYNKEIKIKSHALAKQDFGTGLVMMCSFGDLTDIRFFREEKLAPVILVDEDGKLNANAGFLQGLNVAKAKERIVDELKKRNLLVKEEKILHRVPICERSKNQIEFIELKELYLKQLDFLQEIKKIAKKINFYDESSRQILLDWIESINQDWPISRRRYYATPIPLWYCKKCGRTIIGKPGRYWQPWQDRQSCCGQEAEPELRVFDTWFDSSISCLYILGYKRNESFFKNSWPCSLRPQGKEIIRTWLYYTLLRCYQLTNKQAFRNVWINYHILGSDGRKMSKSLGNFVDINQILSNYGSEAIRLWTALEGDLTKQDFACSEQKIAAETKTLTKLWNIARFILQFKKVKKLSIARLCETDKIIISTLEEITELANNCYEKYDFHTPALKIRNFLWEIFASHYLELVKNRAYNQNKEFSKQEQESAIFTLYYVLERLLLLIAPILPVITYSIYKELKDSEIHEEKFPDARKIKTKLNMLEIAELNSQIWKAKKEKNLSLRAEIKKAILPSKFKAAAKDLRLAHNISELQFADVKEPSLELG